MKLVIGLFFGSMVFTVTVSGQTYSLDSDLSKVEFVIRNFGVGVKGEFHDIRGRFFLSEDDITTSHFEAYADVSSIDTGIGLRDRHLKNETYFDAERFPKIKIESKRITQRNGHWSAEVQITIKKIMREAVIDFTTDKEDQLRWFDATFTVNRLDFKVGENSLSLSDEVIVHLHVAGIEAGPHP